MSELVIQVCPECDRPLAGVGTRVIDGDTICYVCAECHDHEAANAALEAENAALRAGIETAFNICKDSTDRAIRITVTCMLAGALQAFGDGKGGGVLLAAKRLADASLAQADAVHAWREHLYTCPRKPVRSREDEIKCPEWDAELERLAEAADTLSAPRVRALNAYRAALAAEKGADADGS